ncbi:MAG TPA: TadE/TadG family type IV pilus assembly protein [Gemmatimonadota bacterium]|jgi:Flp pilus assembly protein TadG
MRGSIRLRDARGTTVAEMAIVLPLVLVLVMGVFDFSRLFYTRLTLQHAVREAVRFAVTGNASVDPQTGDPLTRIESIRRKIVENAVNLDVDVDAIVVTPADGGGPGDVVTVATTFSYEMATPVLHPFFPGGRYDFGVSSAMKNEPFYTD